MAPQASSARSFHFSNSDNDSMDIHDENYNSSKSRSSQKKQSGACVDCKSVKVRCEFIVGERKCRRCQAKNLPCQPRERKKRKAADTHEQLQERSHEQDIHIQNLLKQYDQRVAEQKVHHWVSNSSIPRTGDAVEGNWLHKGKSPELAVMSYYAGGIPTQHLVLPGIVKHCSLYPEDIQQLFSIFFTHINPYFSILDETYHTPEKLLWTSPFLFTVLCGVASRYYAAKPNLYSLAMEFARDLAGQGLVEGHRSVDVCQAYLLMAVYPVPKKKWVEDRSWLLMGVAIRMAIELELNQPPPPTCDEREALNRTRTWLNCFCVDGSHATQYGKLPMLSLDDYLARNSREWYRSSPLNTPYDIHLCAYVQILMQLAHWREYMKHEGDCSTKPQEIVTAALQMQERLSAEMDVWADAYAAEYEFMSLPISIYLGNTTQLIVAYLRLVVLLAGFQKMKLEDLSRGSEILIKSVDAARSVIQIASERLYPSGYLRYAMESNFLYMSFAAAFLINLFRPRYLSLLDTTLRQEVIVSVSRLISILGSNDVALDGRHTPAVHSKFLSTLMLKRGLTMNNMWTLSREQSPHSDPGHRQLTPPDEFSWPDVQGPSTPSQNPSLRLGSSCGAQFQSDRLMDYSLSHFIKTVISYAPTPSDMDVATNMTWDSWKSEEEPTIMWSPPTAPQGIWAS
ncbi:hypothetical protein HYPSUDRAFT_68639 [Hypholoma sublateritium FD-334 SS-4]|uniref:Zn(2)-C6 fungal-type domain-containing protein n=1 Tax=Hypholoma sublateritium (strain FD-334 SS-4) TaxID=945553 RepID=A0A0D2PJW9_HYPSF|nr:hypothetical protein HYPSUDRAFT_68639 [Hypholoma sublateritium FD-334 SS-4]